MDKTRTGRGGWIACALAALWMMAAGGAAAPRGENRHSDGASLPKGKISRAAGPLAGSQWINLGPAPILGYFQPSSGRVADIAADPADPGHWLIGAAGGGVWETRDGGAGWIAKTDNQAAAAIGSVAFAPSDPRFLYAGTGEAFTQDAYNGRGLLKSSDGGATWQLLGADSFSELAFRGIQIHPADPNILLAATALPQRETRLPVKSPGIFKSTDGGATWTRKLDGNSTDLQRDPGRFDHLYTALWNTGAAGTGLYRSMDGGESWALIDGPWSAAGSGVGRIALAVAPSDPDILYVSVHDVRTDGLLGIWRSDRAWDPSPPFAKVPLSFREYQMHRNHKIIVDPSNPSVLYLGGTQLWKFDGTRWSNVRKEIHVDQQSMAWAGDRLIVGNDGGVFSTADGGNSWQSHNTNLSITQFYKGALHPTNPNFLLAGSEDNGVGEWTGTNSWRDILVGDGADAAISSLHPDTDWAAASFNLQISRTKDGGATFSRADGGIDKSGVPFIAHFEKCPSNDDLFIAGTVRLWKTDGFFSSPAPSWSPDSPPLPAGDEIRAMAFAPADPSCHTYAFGTKQGALRLTADGGKSWVDLDAGNAVPDRGVSALAFHPSDSNILYVALSGFDEAIPAAPGHLFKTGNALAASPGWSNVGPPSDLPHHAVLLDPGDPEVLYAGTDGGVWKSADAGASWTPFGPESGMPNVPVLDLKANAATGRLVAFTHGRGAFVLASGTTAVIAAGPLSGAPPLTVHFNGAGSADPGGTIASYSWDFGDGGTGIDPVIDHTYAAAGTYTAKLTVAGRDGRIGAAQVAVQVGSPAASPGGGGGCTLIGNGDGGGFRQALSYLLAVFSPFWGRAGRFVAGRRPPRGHISQRLFIKR